MSKITNASPSADDAFLAAEWRLTDLYTQRKALYREHQPLTVAKEDELIIRGVDVEIDRLEDLIDGTQPQTLTGAAVKLRRLADPNQLLCNDQYDRDRAYNSARQVLALVERLIATPASDPVVAMKAELDRVEAEAKRLEDAGDDLAAEPLRKFAADLWMRMRDVVPISSAGLMRSSKSYVASMTIPATSMF